MIHYFLDSSHDYRLFLKHFIKTSHGSDHPVPIFLKLLHSIYDTIDNYLSPLVIINNDNNNETDNLSPSNNESIDTLNVDGTKSSLQSNDNIDNSLHGR